MSDPAPRSAGSLLTDALRALSDLVRGEIALAKAEAASKLRQAGGGLGMIAAGAVVALVALNALAGAAIAALVAQGLAAGWAGLIVAVALALIALVLVAAGKKALDPDNLMPRRTARNLRRDAIVVKETLSDDTAH
ncbi:MAG: phage holin family protein [Pseudooceanicola sp.]|nr:phage holin family protein [Pseudooceanicola sp.]